MKKLIGFVAGLLLPVVALAGVDLSNQLKLGDKTASDKKIVFDKGSGAANPALKWNNGTSKLQFANDGSTYKDFGSGSGSGINLIANGDAEDGSVTGWTTYDDGGAFVDGTAGTSSATYTNTAVTPLRDTKSFLYTSGAAGNGACYTFTVQPSDMARMLRFTGEYSIASGTYPTDDLQLWIYDVTNSAAIQPAPYKLSSIASGVTSNFMAEFQTSATGASYRACFHQATTATYTVKLDTLSVGPTPKILGTPVTDWVSYTPTIGNLGTGGVASSTGFYRRVGDTVEIEAQFTKDGSGGSGASQVNFTFPAGLTADTTKFDASSVATFGNGLHYAAANAHLNIGDVTGNKAGFRQNDGTGLLGSEVAAGAIITYRATVPISGWSSSTVMSEGAATRVVAARCSSTTSSITSGGVYPNFTTEDYDTHGAMDCSLGAKFTAPVKGLYRVCSSYLTSASTWTNIGDAASITLDKNNGDYVVLGSQTNQVAGLAAVRFKPNGCATVSLNTTDYVRVYFLQSPTGNVPTGSVNSFMDIERISGPDQIAASEKIYASYYSTSGQSIPNATYTIIDFANKEADSHGAVTTGASWKFTAKSARVCTFSSAIRFLNATNIATFSLAFYKNGGASTKACTTELPTTGPTVGTSCSASMQLNEGDYVDARVYQAAGAAKTLITTAGEVFITALCQ